VSFIVKIEFSGIQRFIFDVPRLAVMRGANALLGQVIREDLVSEAIELGSKAPPMQDYIGTKDKNDPLVEQDDPQAMWNRGILSRDGGHFTAHFLSEVEAIKFAQSAHFIICEKIPSVTFSVDVLRLNNAVEGVAASTEHVNVATSGALSPTPAAIPCFPVFQSCQLSHKGVAQERLDKGKNEDEMFYVAMPVYRQHEDTKLSNSGEANKTKASRHHNDLGSLLIDRLKFPEGLYQKASELNHLAGNDYLALIVADGNDMGNRAKAYVKEQLPGELLSGQSQLKQDALFENFYYTARVALRRAVKSALMGVFKLSNETINEKIRPFDLFMMGGDDLMLACRAKYALPLVEKITHELQQRGLELADGKPLSLGCGVVMAKATMPIHRLQHITEALASSAKTKWRSLPKQQQRNSTVDWEVITQAWIDEPIVARQKNHVHRINNHTLLTTGKPYLCHDGSSSGEKTVTLETLLSADENLNEALESEDSPARSQMLNALHLLPKGELASTIAWRKVPENTRKVVEVSLNVPAFPWQTFEKDTSVSQTYFADFMEVHELKNKQRRISSTKQGVEK